MRFHLLGIPQIDTNRNFWLNGFCPKIYNFARILKELGHTVILYTGEHNTAPCDEAVVMITDKEREKWLGGVHYVFAAFELGFAMWEETNKRMIAEIGKRKQAGDYLCTVGGTTHKPIADAHPDLTTIEFGVGYGAVFAQCVVYESHSWRQYVYGKCDAPDQRFYDTVIPNYFDVDDFPMGTVKKDYLLYCGRMNPRKGLKIVQEIAERTKIPTKVIGPGALPDMGPRVEVLGAVSIEERARMMGEARAVLVPTVYYEPFGSTVVEAQLCGTPVITTDYGSFPELVENGVNGYRCNLLREFCAAAENVKKLDGAKIRERAIAKYSIEAIKPLYAAYFDRLSTLKGKGWYTE